MYVYSCTVMASELCVTKWKYNSRQCSVWWSLTSLFSFTVKSALLFNRKEKVDLLITLCHLQNDPSFVKWDIKFCSLTLSLCIIIIMTGKYRNVRVSTSVYYGMVEQQGVALQPSRVYCVWSMQMFLDSSLMKKPPTDNQVSLYNFYLLAVSVLL